MKRGMVVVLGVVLGGGVARASTISFGDMEVGTPVTNQYAGVTISGGTVVYGGALKNSSAGAIRLTFATLQSSVTGTYTASQLVSISSYGASGNLLSSSLLLPSFGQSAIFSVGGGGIASVAIRSLAGGNVMLDDVSYSYSGATSSSVPTTNVAQTPEPGSLLLMGTGLFAAAGMCICRASMIRRGEIEGGVAL